MKPERLQFPCVILREGGFDPFGHECFSRWVIPCKDRSELIQYGRRFHRFHHLEGGGGPSPRTIEQALEAFKLGGYCIDWVDAESVGEFLDSPHFINHGLKWGLRACAEEFGWIPMPFKSRTRAA